MNSWYFWWPRTVSMTGNAFGDRRLFWWAYDAFGDQRLFQWLKTLLVIEESSGELMMFWWLKTLSVTKDSFGDQRLLWWAHDAFGVWILFCDWRFFWWLKMLSMTDSRMLNKFSRWWKYSLSLFFVPNNCHKHLGYPRFFDILVEKIYKIKANINCINIF